MGVHAVNENLGGGCVLVGHTAGWKAYRSTRRSTAVTVKLCCTCWNSPSYRG